MSRQLTVACTLIMNLGLLAIVATGLILLVHSLYDSKARHSRKKYGNRDSNAFARHFFGLSHLANIFGRVMKG